MVGNENGVLFISSDESDEESKADRLLMQLNYWSDDDKAVGSTVQKSKWNCCHECIIFPRFLLFIDFIFFLSIAVVKGLANPLHELNSLIDIKKAQAKKEKEKEEQEEKMKAKKVEFASSSVGSRPVRTAAFFRPRVVFSSDSSDMDDPHPAKVTPKVTPKVPTKRQCKSDSESSYSDGDARRGKYGEKTRQKDGAKIQDKAREKYGDKDKEKEAREKTKEEEKEMQKRGQKRKSLSLKYSPKTTPKKVTKTAVDDDDDDDGQWFILIFSKIFQLLSCVYISL